MGDAVDDGGAAAVGQQRKAAFVHGQRPARATAAQREAFGRGLERALYERARQPRDVAVVDGGPRVGQDAARLLAVDAHAGGFEERERVLVHTLALLAGQHLQECPHGRPFAAACATG